MSRLKVVQEIVFDLASNTSRPTLWTGYGFFGREVAIGQLVTPHQVMAALHPDDVECFVDLIEKMSDLAFDTFLACNVRFLHANGDYVATEIRAQLELAAPNDLARLVRCTVSWQVPDGILPAEPDWWDHETLPVTGPTLCAA